MATTRRWLAIAEILFVGSLTEDESLSSSTNDESVSSTNDAPTAFEHLRALLAFYPESQARYFRVEKTKTRYSLYRTTKAQKTLFAAVVKKARHVSFYVHPLNLFPQLAASLSPQLLAVRTKSGGFFNFKTVDEEALHELRGLLERAFDLFTGAPFAR